MGVALLLLEPNALTVCMALENLRTTKSFLSESWVSVRGHGSSSRTMTQSTLQKAPRKDKALESSEVAMSPDLNPIAHLWRDFKTSVGRRHPSNVRAGAVGKRRVVQNSSRELYVTHSWLQEVIDFSYFFQRVCYQILS